MKNVLIALCLFLAFATAAKAQYPQTQTPPAPTATNWSVQVTGCPAPSGIPAALTSQWSAVSAVITANAPGLSSAQVAANQALLASAEQQASVALAAQLAKNPQTYLQVQARFTYNATTGSVVFGVSVAPYNGGTLPSGMTCATS